MPIYVYDSEFPDQDGAATVERLFSFPPPERIRENGIWFRRSPVAAISVTGLASPPQQGSEILRGYHAEECRQGSRFRSRYSADTIRRQWENDAPSTYEVAHDAPP